MNCSKLSVNLYKKRLEIVKLHILEVYSSKMSTMIHGLVHPAAPYCGWIIYIAKHRELDGEFLKLLQQR